MLANLYGNPHSDSAPALLSGEAVDAIRLKTLRFFNADPEHFDIIFTANATAAVKLVAESFRDLASSSSVEGGFNYCFHKDAHTSLVGVRELSGRHHCFGNDAEAEDWLSGSSSIFNNSHAPGLFAYPGQSNMTGRRLPLSWPFQLRSSPFISHQNTYSLLDAAALATTSQIDLSDPETAPDFTALSFYKIFGFPDLGALIVRRKSGHVLSWRRYFGGGTVDLLTVLRIPSVRRKDETLHDALEDGTLPFHSIIALGCAIDVHRKLYGSMETISRHTLFLAKRMYEGMINLRHGNGQPVCTVYRDDDKYEPCTDPKIQGATIAFNVVDSEGRGIGHTPVEQMASQKNIYLRSGGLCNPGGIASYLKVEPWQFKRAQSAGYRCGTGEDELQVINGTRMGVVRASLGAMSTISDVDSFIEFLKGTFVQSGVLSGAMIPLRLHLENGMIGQHGDEGQLRTEFRQKSLTESCSSCMSSLTKVEDHRFVTTLPNSDVGENTSVQGGEDSVINKFSGKRESHDIEADKMVVAKSARRLKLTVVLWMKDHIHI
jgi:molybdenum cofactor sulfurtransferase